MASNCYLSSINLLQELHWLPIHSRITFKLASITYKTLSTNQPIYLRSLLDQYTIFEHYATLISIFLTGDMSAQSLAKKPSHIKLPTFGTLFLYQLDILYFLFNLQTPSQNLPTHYPSGDCRRLRFSSLTLRAL